MSKLVHEVTTVPVTEAGPPSDTTVGGQPPEANEADQPGTGVEQTTVDSGAPAQETRTWQPPMAYNNVPDELKAYPFCCWRYEQRGTAKPAKVPYNPKTGTRAVASDPNTFATYDEAVQAFQAGGYDGIGVGIFGDLAAIDIDGCIDDNGQLTEMAEDIIRSMNAYTEVSPSGRGIRILFRVPSNYIYNKARYYINNPSLHMEIYVAGATKKYVTITGRVLTACRSLEVRGTEMEAIKERYMVRSQQQTSGAATTSPPSGGQPPADGPPQLTESDRQIIEAIQRSDNGELFMQLGNGNMSVYDNDHSTADLAFCNILAARTNDPEQIDRIFRASQLMRPKWDTLRGDITYGSMTIQRALAGAGQYRAQRRAEQMAEAAALSATPVPIRAEDQQNTPAPDLAAAQAAAYVAADSPPVGQATQTIGSDGILAYQMGQQQAMLAQYQSISAYDLNMASLPDVQYLVDGILPEGTSILAAASKIGKSWLVLALGLAVSAGKTFMGRPTTQAGVLYLALEDSERRLQSRMRKILKSGCAPSNFYFMTQAPTLAGGLLDVIDAQIAQHPDIKLVIIDTFQMIRDMPRGKESPYASDYREMGALKNYADSKGLSVLLVHHTRKMADPDAFNMISGTTGIMGAADTIWVIHRERRDAETATLCVTGRDVFQNESIVRFNEDDCMWEYVGSVDQVADKDARKEYDNNPVVQAVRALVDDSPGGVWRGLSADIIKQMGAAGAVYTSQAVAREILRFADQMREYDCINYRPSKSSGGCRHCFSVNEFSDAPFSDEDDPEDDTDTSAPSQPAE